MKRVGAVLAVSAIATTLAGCGNSTSEGGSGSTESLSVGYSSPIASQPGQALLQQGLTSAADELGWDTQFYDANLAPATQVSDVQTMIGQQKSVIGLWPMDSNALAGSFAQAKSADIPVIAVNTEADDITSTVWWETNLCEEGSPYQQDAERIAAARPGGSVIVMGGAAVPSIQANVTCFTDAAEAAGLEVLTEVDNVADSSGSAAGLAGDALTRYPDVDAFWAYNDSSALGISSAVVAAGGTVATGDAATGTIVLGTNGDTEAIEAVQQGRLTGTWDTDPYATGFAVARAIRDAVDGDPADITVAATFYDSSNIADYVAPADRDYDIDDFPLAGS